MQRNEKPTFSAYAAWWWSIHCSQSCNDLTLFAVGSMCAGKENPKAGRSLQSFSLRLNVVQKPATTSLEMKRICCCSWACTCRRFICALKDSFHCGEVYPQGNIVDFLFASSAMVREDWWTISAFGCQYSTTKVKTSFPTRYTETESLFPSARCYSLNIQQT